MLCILIIVIIVWNSKPARVLNWFNKVFLFLFLWTLNLIFNSFSFRNFGSLFKTKAHCHVYWSHPGTLVILLTKNRITVMLCYSVCVEKLKSLVIGNSRKFAFEIWMWNLYPWHGNPTESRGWQIIFSPSRQRTYIDRCVKKSLIKWFL